LVGGTLIDGTGSAPLRDSVVLIRGERIERVGTIVSLPVPNGYEAVSTEGLTVLPGLWDLHVHLMYAGHPDPRHWFDTYTTQFERVIMPASAEQMLMAGVTTVRCESRLLRCSQRWATRKSRQDHTESAHLAGPC
jgi:imidazolonepropionase-like amidohydrolase